MSLNVIFSEIPDTNPAAKPIISRRSALLSLAVLMIFLIYFGASFHLALRYTYTSGYNCTYADFANVTTSAYALVQQFFHPFGNITPELQNACHTLFKVNAQANSIPRYIP